MEGARVCLEDHQPLQLLGVFPVETYVRIVGASRPTFRLPHDAALVECRLACPPATPSQADEMIQHHRPRPNHPRKTAKYLAASGQSAECRA